MEQEEKARLAQLGKDRRLAEAVGALDLAIADYTRIAGDENSTDEAVMQAAADYRAAVQRRNIAFDKAAGDSVKPSVELGDRESGPVSDGAGQETSPPPAGDEGKGKGDPGAAGAGKSPEKGAEGAKAGSGKGAPASA